MSSALPCPALLLLNIVSAWFEADSCLYSFWLFPTGNGEV